MKTLILVTVLLSLSSCCYSPYRPGCSLTDSQRMSEHMRSPLAGRVEARCDERLSNCGKRPG